ncbi:CotH kinase family protein [Shivajiella indica]|uniref:CotH kinase family protein n=1 Tax=Shivajiella indica TaxID=872115 RepID=A0ABW5B6F6_9BACT
MDLSTMDYEALTMITGEKVNLRAKNLNINNVSFEPEEIHTRGKSTLNFKRKSLAFSLNSAASFQHNEKNQKLKKFDLLSLSMDKYYIRNRLAFQMMEHLELFELFYTFSEFKINGNSEGIYLVVERPQDWALQDRKSPLIIRRGYNHSIDKIKLNKKADKKESKFFVDSFRQIYKILPKYQGEELYQMLSERIDLENYMRWLAFNYFVHNGDYADEVFFYADPKSGKLRIIPWDYDDIFAKAPHEGKEVTDRILSGKLIFSSEDALDVKIATDEFLYAKYLQVFKEVLEKLDPDILKQIFENTFSELYPYYSDIEIISHSQYDYYKYADIEKLKKELNSLFLQLLEFRTFQLNNLERPQNLSFQK